MARSTFICERGMGKPRKATSPSRRCTSPAYAGAASLPVTLRLASSEPLALSTRGRRDASDERFMGAILAERFTSGLELSRRMSPEAVTTARNPLPALKAKSMGGNERRSSPMLSRRRRRLELELTRGGVHIELLQGQRGVHALRRIERKGLDGERRGERPRDGLPGARVSARFGLAHGPQGGEVELVEGDDPGGGLVTLARHFEVVEGDLPIEELTRDVKSALHRVAIELRAIERRRHRLTAARVAGHAFVLLDRDEPHMKLRRREHGGADPEHRHADVDVCLELVDGAAHGADGGGRAVQHLGDLTHGLDLRERDVVGHELGANDAAAPNGA